MQINHIRIKSNARSNFRIILMLLAALIALSIPQSASAVEWDTFWSDNFMRSVPGIGPWVANSPDTTMMQFYPVENWEVEVCTRDVTSMKDRSDRNNNVDTPRVWYDGASVALAGSYYKYSTIRETLYNVDWYIEPRNSAVKYSIYFKDTKNNSPRFYVKEFANLTVGMQASTGAISRYYNQTYDVVGIEYIELDSNNMEISRQYLEADLALSEAAYE